MGSSSKALIDKRSLRVIFVGSFLGVPLLSLASPNWLLLQGVGPSWSVIWLLPWSLAHGPLRGALAGFYLGLILDAINHGGVTEVPVLMILGFWWGRIGRFGWPLQISFNLALLAWIGSALLSLSFWVQMLLTQIRNNSDLFNSWSLQTLLLQAVVTSLLAPIFCSWLLLLFRRLPPLVK